MDPKKHAHYTSEIETNNVRGAMVPSKARWVERGELISSEEKLKLNDRTEAEDQGAILRKEEKFYRTLYGGR